MRATRERVAVDPLQHLGLPTRGAALLLQAACHVDPDRAFAAWSTLVRDAGDVGSLLRWAGVGAERRLLPLLGRRVELLELPAAVAATCKDVTVEAWGLNERLLVLTEQPLRTLAAEMPVIALKGLALLGDVFPEHPVRPLGDLDILVPREQAPEALGLLDALGWRDTDPDRPFRFTLLPAINLAGSVAGSIDVHWHASWPTIAPRRDRGPVPGTVEPLPEGHPMAGLGLSRATPPRLLVQLVVNGMKPEGTPLHWLADVAELLARHPSLDWDEVVRAADEDEVGLVTHVGLTRVRDLLGAGADLPLEELQPTVPHLRRQQRRVRATSELLELDGRPGARIALARLRRYVVRLARPGRPLHALRIAMTVVIASLRLRVRR